MCVFFQARCSSSVRHLVPHKKGWSFVRSTKKYREDPMNSIVVFAHAKQASGGIKGQYGKGGGNGDKGGHGSSETVYRSEDKDHLVFLNSIRDSQPSREKLAEDFGDRFKHKRHHSLTDSDSV